MGYTGVVSEYFVTPVETGIEEKVSDTEYNLFKNSKDYSNQRIGKTESRLPEIVKNIALILPMLFSALSVLFWTWTLVSDFFKSRKKDE